MNFNELLGEIEDVDNSGFRQITFEMLAEKVEKFTTYG